MHGSLTCNLTAVYIIHDAAAYESWTSASTNKKILYPYATTTSTDHPSWRFSKHAPIHKQKQIMKKKNLYPYVTSCGTLQVLVTGERGRHCPSSAAPCCCSQPRHSCSHIRKQTIKSQLCHPQARKSFSSTQYCCGAEEQSVISKHQEIIASSMPVSMREKDAQNYATIIVLFLYYNNI